MKLPFTSPTSQLTPVAPDFSAASDFVRRGSEVCVYYNQRQTPGLWPRYSHQQTEILFLQEGAACRLGWCTAENVWSQRELHGRHVCIIAGGLVREFHLTAESELLIVHVEQRAWERMACPDLASVTIVEDSQTDFVFWHLTWALRRLFSDDVATSATLVDHIGGSLVERLIERVVIDDPAQQNAQGSRLSSAEFRKVLGFMEANLKHDIHVIDLAKQTGHCVAHFAVLFKNRTGKSPFQYLKELRMQKAHALIFSGGSRIKEIAVKVGYTNFDHFSEVFRTYWKYTARELLTRVRRSK